MKWFVLVLAIFATARQASSQCTSFQGYGENTATSISLYAGSGWIDAPPISSAISMWKNGCFGMTGRDFPYLSSGTGGEVKIAVSRLPGRNPTDGAGCARFEPDLDADEVVQGGTIEIYAMDNAGADCLYVMPHAILDNLIAHELGHVLGLANATSSACNNFIMGREWSTATVQGEECQTVDEGWCLPNEPADDPPPNPPITCQPPVCATPLIISERNDYRMTSAADGVAFDIDADGIVDQVSWTAAGADVAFLSMDRDANGRVEDGSELFGDHTPLATGAIAEHGFEALVELDVNGDGFVDASDPAWNALLLWFDSNHDGRSTPHELVPVSATAIVAIDTTYKWSGKKDPYGNLFRYKGDVTLNSGVRKFYDIFLQIAMP